jgi:sulfotransferase
LHTLRPTVEARPRRSILPPDLFNRFVDDAFWREPADVPEGLQIV